MTEIRNRMEAILKKEMHGLALRIYEEERMTQTRMANALVMDKRSYAAIASGEHKCGELTIVLMLLRFPDSGQFLRQLGEKLEAVFVEEMLLI